jgi:polyisoprenyl-teichoic acid--peptidoglycan teichoic acid transferase
MDNSKNTINLKTEGLQAEPVASSNITKKKGLYWKLSASSLIFALMAFLAFNFWPSSNDDASPSHKWLSNFSIISGIKHIVEGSDKQLKGEEQDRINILLLGMGGKNHDGGYLTDTIMVASLQPSTKKVAMISVPRDLAVPIENMGWRKINNVNAFAEKQEPGSGGLAISQTVSDTLDIPIDYYIRVDFTGFINIIDKVGGIDVYVDNTLDDYSYPVLGREDAYPYESRYEHLHVDTGWQKMDGQLALKFARSRHGIRGEGSDFARAKRQQKIIEAAKDKVVSASTLFKPTMIAGIINEMQENVSTNLKVWEIAKLWDLFKDTKSENITNKVLDNSAGGLLISSISAEGAYILSPRGGDFKDIQYMVKTVFGDAVTATKKTQVTNEKSSVEVYNGTWINGLASNFATDLEKEGFDILLIANSSQKNFQKTVIYDLSNGKKAQSLSALKTKTGANVSPSLPDWLENSREANSNNTKPDFIIILGNDADKTASGHNNPQD